MNSLAPIPNLDPSANLEFTIVNDGSNSRIPVFTWRVPGLWHDIGSPETLEEANRLFAQYGAMRGPSRSDR